MASGTTHLVFLDTTGDRDQALQLIEEVGRLGSHVPVIAILGGNEPDFILRCLRAGASDFLILPLTSEQVDAAFGKLSRAQPAQEAAGGKEPAKTIAVMPAKGACGATTVACNLAFQWKRTSGKKVLLVDMDPLTGNLSFLLKIKSVYSFLDALQRSNELDADLWGAMVRPVHGVDVLLAPELMLDQNQDLRDPSPILEYARHAYDVVILDTSSVYTEWNLNIARGANELLLVTTNELPALQAAQRALSYLDTNRIGRWKIRLVVNRYLRDVGLSREVIGTALHTEVFETLPSDYDAVQKALLDGKAIPASTPFGKGMVEIVERLGGKSQPAKRGSSLSGLLGLFSKTSK
ncbi:MAG: AAA family ATPase [Acidobacteriota bacterium]|nr:AAA family ATPase [Acidobacteriota bacterium]